MRRKVSTALKLAVVVAILAAACSGGAQTQEGLAGSRITQSIDDRQRIVLPGNTHRLARPEFDRGAAPPDLQLDHMLLVLTRTPQQQAALDKLLQAQQDKTSANYHQWLTPHQFGELFGASPDDIAQISGWLESHGFTVDAVPASLGAIEFSGTAGQLQEAFHTAMHRYQVRGEKHWANASDPEIPAALGEVVGGVVNLNSFFARTNLQRSSMTFPIPSATGAQPLYSLGWYYNALGPQDFAVIYNLNSLYQSGTNGAGAVIGVVGRSNINVQDVDDFRRLFGLSNNPPQVVVNGTNPGDLGGGEEMEAVLDNSWSGAVAPGATVKFVVSASTETADGTLLSEQYIINNNLADVMTESFGLCEADVPQSYATYLAGLAQQAAAEGITYMVSAGDAGSTGCDNDDVETVATGPLSVNVFGSSPYATTVGGTQFNETVGAGPYWSESNLSAYYLTALSYIPEDVWNQSCPASKCDNPNIVAGGGGASQYFTKPSWQSGVAGIPSDGARDVPDVSLTASAAHDPYLLCIDGSCASNMSTPNFQGIGGTSASAPAFAGIMALVKQKTGARQGSANAALYHLAASEQLSGCNASSGTLPGSSCIFNDVTSGNNSVPGGQGYGTSNAPYTAGTGFDLATGLGSVNAANLVNQWSSGSGTSNPGVSLSPLTIAFGNETVNTTSAAKTVTLTNSGNATLNISSITTTGTSPRDFGTTTTCGSSLSASASCTISVTFAPTAAGAMSAKLTVADNAAGSPQSVSLSGTGVSAPVVSLSSTSLAFGTVEVGAASAVQTVTLSNTGTAALVIKSTALTGTSSAAFVESNTCGTSVSAESHCTISVKMQPPSAGGKSAAVTMTDNAAGSPHSITLSGTAVQPTVSLSPASLNFSSQAVGTSSDTQTVSLTNTSSLTLVISSIAVGGANAPSFVASKTCGSTLSAGTSCTISLKFAPGSAGSKSGTLVVTDNGANSPQSVSLTGTATSPLASLSPSNIAFGNQAAGTTSSSKTVTLTNTGTAPMAISSIALAGTSPRQFAETTNCGSTLNASASCTISVTFAPLAAASLAADVTVTDNAPGSPQNVSLSGTSVTPTLALSRASLNFGSQALSATSTPQTVTLTNTSAVPLSISSVAITGANPSSFQQSKTCGTTVNAGATCTISVAFQPGAMNAKSAAVTITDNAVGSPHTLPLDGTGTPDDFSFTIAQPMQTVAPGSGASFTVGINPADANCGTISLTASGLPAGATGSFTPASLSEEGSSTFGVATSGSTPTGSYPITLTATNGSFTHTVTATLLVNPVGYSVGFSQSSQTVSASGSSTSYTVNVSGAGSGTVWLALSGLPAGASASFNPPSLSGSGSSVIALATSASTPVGVYPLTVTAEAGNLITTASATLVVGTGNDFSIDVTPQGLGTTAGSVVNLAVDVTGVGTPAAAVSLQVSGLPTGATASLSPTSIDGSGTSSLAISTSSSTPAGVYTIAVTGTGGSAEHSATVTLAVRAAGNYEFNISPSSQQAAVGSEATYNVGVEGASGPVSLAVNGLPTGATASFQSSSIAGSGSSAVTVKTSSSTPAGTYTLTFTATGGGGNQTATAKLVVGTVTGTDFTIGVAYPILTVSPGGPMTFTVQVGLPANNTGAVLLTATGLPPGAAGSFAPSAISSTETASFDISTAVSTPPGAYPLTFTGTSGSFVYSATATLVVLGTGDYYLGVSPSMQSVLAGNAATFDVQTLGGNTTAWFTVSGLPAGATAAFTTPGLVTGSGTSEIAVSTSSSTPAGTYTLTFTADDGITTHTVTSTLAVIAAGSFLASASPSSQTVSVGGSTSYTLDVSGASGSVSLTLSGLPAGASASFNPPFMNGSGADSIALATSSSTVPGTYTLTITATNGSHVSTAQANLVVASSSDVVRN